VFSCSIRNGVENMLMHYIPEVKGIEEVGQIGADEEESKLLFKSDA
jgi:Fe-S cluster biogenesis protein NfuA